MAVIPISLIVVSLSTLIQVAPQFKNRVVLRRILAALVLAAPAILSSLVAGSFPIGFLLTNTVGGLLITICFSCIAIGVNFFYASAKNNIKIYPNIRQSLWTPGLLLANTVSLMVYLTAYEWLFRSFLFFGCLSVYPMWFAILINVIVYAGAHLHQGPRETILSVPFGIILCLISWFTGTFLTAAIIHIALSLSNDYFAIRANPEMHFSFSSSKKHLL